MFLAQFELDLEPSGSGHAHDVGRGKVEIRKPFRTFDAGEADVRTEIQIIIESSLFDCDLEWPAAGVRIHSIGVRGCELAPRSSFVGNHPARHRDLDARHEMCALREVCFEREWVVAGIEGTRKRGESGNPDPRQIVTRAHECCPGSFWAHVEVRARRSRH